MNTFRIKDLRFRILKGGKIGLCASIMMFGILNSTLSANTVVYDGNSSSGVFVGSDFFDNTRGNLSYTGTDTNLTVGNNTDTTVFTNYFTEGGAGSGGGAGLGGVFFVNQGSTLTLNNTIFSFNTVKGGEGGSLPAQVIEDTNIIINQLSLGLTGFEQQQINPTLTYNAITGKYSFDTIAVATGTKLLNKDSGVVFSELGSGISSTIASVSNSSIILDSPIVIDNSNITSITNNINNGTGYSSSVVGGKTVITFNYIDSTNPQNPVTNDALIAQIKDKMTFNSVVAVNNGTTADNATIEKVNYDSNGNILSVVLSKTLGVVGNSLDIVPVTKFETKPYVVDTQANTITITGATRGFKEGMYIYDNDGVSTGVKITSVSSDGKTLTVDNASALNNLASITAKSTPFLANNQIKLSAPNPDLEGADSVNINGADYTISNYNSITGVVTLTTAVDSDIRTAIENDGELLTLKVNTVEISGSTITLVDKGQEFTTGMQLKDTDLTISGVSKVNGKIVLTIAGTDSLADLDSTKILALDPLTTGGSMNNLSSTGTLGTNGRNGFNSNYYSAFFADGEGQAGTNGYSGGDGDGAAGGNAGDGGNGSSGLAVNPQLMSELWGATGDFTDAVEGLAVALVPEGIPIPSPEIADIPGAIIDLTMASIDLSTAIANTVFWAQNLNAGIAGMGGAGGDGGDGGSGDEFFGGGSGGAGGNGGEGALSFTDGGSGGAGGLGGYGGFGAGGGSGGAGGTAGSTGAADDGDPGDGGRAGFAAGDGSNGDGLYGNGGSGFGGAIFVREGGTLNITGNALFENNMTVAGSSNNGGEQGENAGSAIFMMKNSTVNLMPGLGNTITFNDDIGDNSGSTYDSASYASGAGADIHIQGNGGLVEFNAENTYSGKTILEGATLKAQLGMGINDRSKIVFKGAGDTTTSTNTLNLGTVGTLLLDEDLTTRRVGTRSIDVAWEGSGGIASGIEEGIVVNFAQLNDGTGQTLNWGTNGFFSSAVDKVLTFGSEQSLGSVEFRNNVNIGLNTASVAVYNTNSEDYADSSTAILSGNWIGNELMVGSDTYNGNLLLSGTNELDKLTILDGTTSVGTPSSPLLRSASSGTISDDNTNTIVKMYGGTLILNNGETLDNVSVDSGALLVSNADLTVVNGIQNNGQIVVNTGTFNDDIINDAQFANGGNISVNENIINDNIVDSTIAQWNQIGEVNANNITNNGNWYNQANVTLASTLINNGTWTSGQIDTEQNYVSYEDSLKTIVSLTSLVGTGTFNISNGDLEISQSGTSTFDGDITGQGAFVKSGNGILTVSQAQEFGKLNVTAGEYISLAEHSLNSALVDATGTFTMNANTTTQTNFKNDGLVNLNANLNTGTDFENNGTTIALAPRTITTVGGLKGSGNIRTADTLTLAQTGDTTYNGTIKGTGSFVKNGTGNLILNGVDGSVDLGKQLVINGGILGLDGANILASTLDVLINDNGTMQLINGNQRIDALAGSGLINLGSNKLEVNDGGTFAGTVVGNGTLDIKNGQFTVSSDITSTEGTFNVNDGATTTINQDSNLIFPTVEVQTGGTLNIEGNVEASNNVVVNTNSTLHLTDGGTIDTNLASVYGTLKGIGSITGTTTAYEGSYLRPGNSPGSITFDDLVLDNNSTTVMEIETITTAGTTFDQIIVNNNLTIKNGAKLDLVKFGAGTELAQGEKAKIFDFTPGKISGYFTDVTSTYANNTILNLQTGEVVGLGGATIAQFESGVTSNANQMKILTDLKVNQTNGVAQYYGGEIASRLASNQGNATETKKIFETFSPEVYSSLLEQNKFNLLSSTSKLPTDLENTKAGLSISMDRNTYETDKNDNFMSYKMEGNEIKIHHTGKFNEGFIVTSVNAIDGDINSKYTEGSTQNYGINIAAVQPLGSENLTFRAQAAYIKGDTDLSRKTYDSTSYANNIDSSGLMAGLGLGYDKKFSNFKLATTLDILYYKSNVDGFTESNANSLDALNIHKQDENGVVTKLKVKATKDLTENLSVSGKVEYNKFFNSDNNKVTANVALEDTLMNVENPGIGNDIIGLGLGLDYKVNKEWSAEFNAGISGDKDLTQNSNVGVQIKYAF